MTSGLTEDKGYVERVVFLLKETRFYFVKNNLYLRIPTYVYFEAPERLLPNRCSYTVSVSSYDGFMSSMFRRIDDVRDLLNILLPHLQLYFGVLK